MEKGYLDPSGCLSLDPGILSLCPDPVSHDDVIALSQCIGIATHLADSFPRDLCNGLRVVKSLFFECLDLERSPPADDVSTIGMTSCAVQIEQLGT